MVGEFIAPVLGNLAGVFHDGVDVALKGQGHDVGFKAVDDRAGLLAGPAMRLLDGDRLARVRLPLGGKGLIVILVELPGGVIRDIEQGRIGKCKTKHAKLDGAGDKCGGKRLQRFVGHCDASVERLTLQIR